ncbi:uncharacterized protein LOC120352148 [Nilaparvata lugens]|uniref:uncharacterized protein LOC120352148 n=1 Tax=Nilaparvata lugens TaxID=108931 RepID=UPI00193E1FD2|nr:uncharacterized protein LOC120352148 [Nilaparvata lugens]
MPRECRLHGVNSAAVRHRITINDPKEISIENVLERSKQRIFDIIREHAARHDANVKWFIVLNVLLYKLVVMDDEVSETVSSLINLHSYSNIALNVLENYEDFNDHFMLAMRKIMSSFDNFVRHGSVSSSNFYPKSASFVIAMARECRGWNKNPKDRRQCQQLVMLRVRAGTKAKHQQQNTCTTF